MTAHIVQGDARRLPLATGSVQCVITSPPYFGLRSYGGQVSVWGGDRGCPHTLEMDPARRPMSGGTGGASAKQVTNAGSQFGNAWEITEQFSESSIRQNGRSGLGSDHPRERYRSGATCTLCGAWRGELGSEPTPAAFVAHLIEVFAEVWRVLRDDGVVFLNIGDSYAGSGKGPSGKNGIGDQAQRQGFTGNGGMHKKRLEAGAIGNAWTPAPEGSRQKSLLLVPERLAIALSDAGWIIRSRIAWCKAAPMPESVRDRPTSAWEHIWVLTKRGSYYWDADAVRQDGAREYTYSPGWSGFNNRENYAAVADGKQPGSVNNGSGSPPTVQQGANLRNFWVLNPDPYPGAHFATFPREIPRRCILAASREGDIVLDPFSGSGTTAFVAASLGRVGVGVELSWNYLEQTRYGRLAQNFLPLARAAAGLGD